MTEVSTQPSDKVIEVAAEKPAGESRTTSHQSEQQMRMVVDGLEQLLTNLKGQSSGASQDDKRVRATMLQTAAEKATAPRVQTFEYRDEVEPQPSTFEEHPAVYESLSQAYKSGKCLIAVFRKEGNVIHLNRHSHNFPFVDMMRKDVEAVNVEGCSELVQLLHADLVKETEGPQREGAKPMEEAQPRVMAVDLFAGDEVDDDAKDATQ